MREVDELLFLDIAATAEGRDPDFDTVDELADECFMPLTVGGGVRTVEHVGRLLRVGADKVSLNTAAVEDPEIVGSAAARYGTQCVVVSIDVRRAGDHLEVFTHAGTRATGLHPVDVARTAEQRGAGEILLTSIDRDGTMEGYDIPLIAAVAEAVGIPVIASGGAGTYAHMAEALASGGASAVAAASVFHFTEQTPLEAKQYLKAAGFPVRV
jgi:imidazole glycerol-phosphate synthase subunit HisF